MRIIISILISFYLFFSPALSQTEKPIFNGQTMLEYIKVLADDSMEGRKSGLPGGKKAALYIADKLKEWGIEPAGENNTYFHNVILEDYFNVEPGASLEILNQDDRRTFSFNQDIHDEWRVCDLSGSGTFETEIVFVGYGIHAPEKGYDDYSGVDVKGKIVLINSGWSRKLGAKFGPELSHEKRIKAAQELGAKGVIFFPEPASIGRHNSYPAFVRIKKEVYNPNFVVLGINAKIADYIFNYLFTNTRYPFSEIERKSKPQSFNTGVRACINVQTTFAEKRATFNVLGKISGVDDKLKNEYVILGAHMDHLGISPRNEVMNGANDNASGTAVVMEVARMMKKTGVKPKRTIIFALWAAEEQGLLGSKYYVEHPLYPLERTVANINLDCVGQGEGKVGLGGIYLSSETWNAFKDKMDKDIMKGMYPRRGVGGSDHLAFLAKGVPAFHMVTGRPIFKLHHPRDDWDLIKPDMLEKAGRFLYQASLVLARIDANFFFPKRAERILFRKESIVNFRLLPSSYIFEHMKKVVSPDIDFQLIYLEENEKASPSELKLEILDALNTLPEKVKKASGLSLYKESAMSLGRSRGRGTRLIVGLKGTSAFKDNPSWLNIYSKMGLRYVMLEKDDLGFNGDELNPAAAEMIKAANTAGILLIISGLDESQQKEVLKASQKPLILINENFPSQECMDLIKQKGCALALMFKSQEEPSAYFEKLKQAKTKLGTDNLIVWNDTCLWREEIQAKYLDLFSHLVREGWTKEDMYRRTDMSRVISKSFLNIMMRLSR